MRVGVAGLFLAFALTVTASAQEKEGAAPAAAAALPSYPAKASGLKKLIQDILKAQKEGKEQAVNAYLNSFLLREPDPWFEQVFGEAQGNTFSSVYRGARGSLQAELYDAFQTAGQQKMTDVDVHRFEKTCDPHANEQEYPVLAARARPEPLYEVSMMRGGTYGRVYWFFAYIDGGFRFIGTYQMSSMPFARFGASGDAQGLSRIRVGGPVQQAKLIHQPPPTYPENAKRERLQGTVRMVAAIGTDGAVHDIHVVQGRCWLAEAAVEAVKKWRYSPTLLDGRPVEVVTTIDVNFILTTHP
jgi:TonB family protein